MTAGTGDGEKFVNDCTTCMYKEQGRHCRLCHAYDEHRCKPQPQVATPPGLLGSQAHAWLTVYALCEKLGMKRDPDRDAVSEVCKFVWGLATVKTEKVTP